MPFRRLLMFVLITVPVCFSLGCRGETSTNDSRSVDTGKSQPMGPEERFAQVLSDFKQLVATDSIGVASGFVASRHGGRTRLIYRTEVEHELIPPKEEGGIYKAIITVITQSNYTLIRPQSDTDSDEEDSDRAGGNDRNDTKSSLFDDQWEDSPELDVFDSEAASNDGSPKRSRSDESEALVSTHEDEDVRHFELAYEGDRWVLKTEPEQESIKEAFDRALGLQF